jgi:hypothetical protein
MAIQHICGVMLTATTYGTWLRGDERGWCEDGRVYPAEPTLELADRERLKHTPFLFEPAQLHDIGTAIGRSLIDRLQQRVLALTVQTWHVHFVVANSDVPIADVAKCAKEAVRYHLRPGRPIWTEDYDKRFCFDEQSLRTRIEYVERHNTERGLPARPWPFLLPFHA